VTHPRDITGVVLAGGLGSRLDGNDKGLVAVANRPMISYVIERFAPQVNSLLISANRNASRYREFGYPVIEDALADYPGPLAGIAAALGRCETRFLATAPCDSPFLPTDLVSRLTAALDTSEADISVAFSGDRPQPVFSLISTQLLDSLTGYLINVGRKISLWYRQENFVELDFGADVSAFSNINSPTDLAAAEARLGVE